MKRLSTFISAILLLELLPAYALAPVLPRYIEEFGLSKSQAGVLVGMYAAGTVIAGLPVAVLASRLGVKRAVIVGLVGFAASTAGFGFADSYSALLATRLLQGISGALCWASANTWIVEATHRGRRGELMGMLAGAAAAGAILGPAVGGAAASAGPRSAFGATGAFALILAIAGMLLAPPARSERQPLADVARVHSRPYVLIAHWLIVLPGLLLGAASVLAPLQLSRLGWGSGGIVVTYVVAACIGVIVRPAVGKLTDRRGRIQTMRPILLASVALSLILPWAKNALLLSVLLVFAVSTFGLLWGPAMAYASDAYERARVPQVLGFGLMNVTGGAGLVIGSAAGGSIAEYAGDAAAYAVVATICLMTFTVLRRPARFAAETS
jgi:MFS family permease